MPHRREAEAAQKLKPAEFRAMSVNKREPELAGGSALLYTEREKY